MEKIKRNMDDIDVEFGKWPMAFFFAWMVMLFAGNVGVNVSYWGALPAGLVLAWITFGRARTR